MWERQVTETNPAWNGFCLYRDYGRDRGILKALALNGIPATRYGVWCKWSAKFDWVKRCGAYDVYLDGLRRAEWEKEYIAREKKYLSITDEMMNKVELRVKSIDPEALSPQVLQGWMDGTFRMVRKIYGKNDDDTIGLGDGKIINGQLEINFVEEFEGL